ncbi:MAG TPA: pyruvate dehydrogenase (acetyl-transferring) E1 component subunit alpha, partial [Methylocystis sp.]
LVSEGAWSKEQEAELHKECAEEVDREVAAYLHASPLSSDAMFEHLYAKLPGTLQWQRDEARRFAQRDANANGNGHG